MHLLHLIWVLLRSLRTWIFQSTGKQPTQESIPFSVSAATHPVWRALKITWTLFFSVCAFWQNSSHFVMGSSTMLIKNPEGQGHANFCLWGSIDFSYIVDFSFFISWERLSIHPLLSFFDAVACSGICHSLRKFIWCSSLLSTHARKSNIWLALNVEHIVLCSIAQHIKGKSS